MVDVVLAFLAGWFLNWYGLIGLCLLGVIAEHNDGRGFAVFMALVASVVAFFFFNLTLADLLIVAGGYMIVGFAWSFWRYRRFVVSEVEKINASDYNQERKQLRVESLHPRNHVDTIVAWVIVWPFSAIENLIGDLITGITTLVTTTFKRAYQSIYESATAGLKVK